MKTLVTAIAALALVALALAPAHAGSAAAELPQKFWGDWKSVDELGLGGTMELSGASIGFDNFPPHCKFIEVNIANEEGTAYDIGWHCSDQATGVKIKMAFRLAKVHGQDVLMMTNEENPTGISIYERKPGSTTSPRPWRREHRGEK